MGEVIRTNPQQNPRIGREGHAANPAHLPDPWTKTVLFAGGTVQALLGSIMLLMVFGSRCYAQSYGERIWTPPSSGTFYSIPLGGTNSPPYPFLPVDPIEVPVYWIYNPNAFLFDGLESYSFATESIPPPPGEGGGGGDSETNANVAYNYGTNDLWLEIFPFTNTTVPLLLHGVKSNYYYQLDQATNLATPTVWKHTNVIHNSTGTNQMPFEDVGTGDLPLKYFRAAEGFPLLQIVPGPDAIEAEGTNDNRTVGAFYVQLADWDQTLSSNLTVYYTISGYKISASAENRADYTNMASGTNLSGILSGSVVLPANTYQVALNIDPETDDLIEFCEFVTFTLVRTNGYLVDPNFNSAVITISDHFMPNVFTVVAENLPFGGGIGYHPLSNSIIAAVKGVGFNFAQIYTNIVFTNSVYVTNTVITNWSGVTNLGQEEIKLAIVQTTTNGFNQGEMFFGPGPNGIVGKISADGSIPNLNWAILSTNQNTSETILRGSLHLDQTCVFTNNLVLVTGNGSDQGGGVWAISSNTNAGQIANITNDLRPHLEGVITLTNNAQLWGPWAGKLLTGAEVKSPPLVHTIDKDRVVASFDMGIEPEDFDIIITNQDLYCVQQSVAGSVPDRIIKLSSTLLTNYCGALLITQEGAQHLPARDAKLFIVNWNSTNSVFVTRCIPNQFLFEHVTFAPITLPDLP